MTDFTYTISMQSAIMLHEFTFHVPATCTKMLFSVIILFAGFFSVILFPIAITFYITWWFIHFVDGFFSPIYAQLGINIFGMWITFLYRNIRSRTIDTPFVQNYSSLWFCRQTYSGLASLYKNYHHLRHLILHEICFDNAYIELLDVTMFFFLQSWL